MTVASSTSRSDYTGNGVTTAFTGAFRILDQTHIVVYRTQISTGAVTTLALTTDYTVSGVGGTSFTVTCLVAPTSDQRISILRSVPLTQASSYPLNDVFPSTTTENALDKLTMQVQQLNEAQGRAITVPANTTGIATALPTPQATTLIGWDGTATSLVNYTPAASTLALQFTSTTGSAVLPKGTTAQRDLSPTAGYFRFNTTLGRFEGYGGSAWGSVGGATGGGSDDAFYENTTMINTSYTITTNKNAMTAGPVTIADGVTVTVPTGSTWSVV